MSHDNYHASDKYRYGRKMLRGHQTQDRQHIFLHPIELPHSRISSLFHTVENKTTWHLNPKCKTLRILWFIEIRIILIGLFLLTCLKTDLSQRNFLMNFKPDKWSCDLSLIPYAQRYNIKICHNSDMLKTFEFSKNFGKKISKYCSVSFYFFFINRKRIFLVVL